MVAHDAPVSEGKWQKNYAASQSLKFATFTVGLQELEDKYVDLIHTGVRLTNAVQAITDPRTAAISLTSDSKATILE
jgi:hypothetical protein